MAFLALPSRHLIQDVELLGWVGSCRLAKSYIRTSCTTGYGRVEIWRSVLRFCLSVAAPFVRRCLNGPSLRFPIGGFSYFSITPPIASRRKQSCRVGFAPTEKRRLRTAHASNGHSILKISCRHACSRFGMGIGWFALFVSHARRPKPFPIRQSIAPTGS